ncbi:MAG: GTPase [Myxococcota bacterium]
MKNASTTRCGFAALVGLPNAGKSTLLNALADMPLAAVTPKPQTTQRLLRGIDTQGDCQIIWVDSPGLLRPRNALHATMQRQIHQAVRHADVLVHVVDVTRSSSESDATPDPLPAAEVGHKPVILVFNKIDLLPCHAVEEGLPKSRDAINRVSTVAGWGMVDSRWSLPPTPSRGGNDKVRGGQRVRDNNLSFRSSQNVASEGSARQKSSKKRNLYGINEHFEKIFNEAETSTAVLRRPALGVSAVTGEGVEELRAAVAGLLPRGPFLFDPREVTDAPERALAGEFIRREAMLQLRQELPYCVAVTVERFDERRRRDPRKPLVEIEAVLHVERASQRPMVVGRGGECVKAIGTAARTVLQQLLDCQVMLRLSVRVQPHWRAHAPSLRKLGYGG